MRGSFLGPETKNKGRPSGRSTRSPSFIHGGTVAEGIRLYHSDTPPGGRLERERERMTTAALEKRQRCRWCLRDICGMVHAMNVFFGVNQASRAVVLLVIFTFEGLLHCRYHFHFSFFLLCTLTFFTFFFSAWA